MNKLWIIRGHSGSGKTTFAISLELAFHFETDQYFMNNCGFYQYEPSALDAAHEWNLRQAESAMRTRHDIVVSNTFVKKKDVLPYLELAKQHNYNVRICHCTGEYESQHDVPKKTIMKQKTMHEPFNSEKKIC